MAKGENNFENSFLGSMDFSIKKKKENILQDKERMERMLEKMHEAGVFDRPDLEDFSDIYTEDKISSDKEYVSSMEKKFNEILGEEEKNLKLISELFEGVVVSQAESSEWLGQDVVVHNSSRYDDIVNGIDAVCEFFSEESENKFLALGLDVTFGSYTKTEIVKKIEKIEKSIKDNKTSKAEYFVDSNGDHKKLEIPKVVVGADQHTVKELFELWDKGDKKALAKHPYQCAILVSLRQQTFYFYKIAESYGRNEIAEKYAEAFNLLNDIVASKFDFLKSVYEDALKDGVIEKIMERVTTE